MKKDVKSVAIKVFFTISFFTILLIEAGVITAPYIILYFYTITIIPLLLYRLIDYWKAKQQLFLLDSCYFVNFFTLIVIWAAPDNKKLLMLQYGLSHGPLLWAVVFYRNSLVLDDIDRITSVYIHIFPPLSAFMIRWFPRETSFRWYKPFFQAATNSTSPFDNIRQIHYDPDIWLWTLGAPILCYLCHLGCYTLIFQIIIRPPEEYVDSFIWTTKRNDIIGSSLRKFTGFRRVAVSLIAFSLVGSLQYVASPFLYCHILPNIIVIAFQHLLIIWNGASYHVEVYRRAVNENNNLRSRDACHFSSNPRVGVNPDNNILNGEDDTTM